MLRSLLAAVRRFFSRRRARRLLAQHLPRGLSEPRVALPTPPPEPPPGEYWTLPLVGQKPSRLLRLAALPPPPAHLEVVQPRNFRLDPRTQAPANEGIVPEIGDPSYRWISPAFRRRYLELPWMARDRVHFLGPMHAEWFLMWWDQTVVETLGPGEPEPWERPEEVDWAMDVCKEQMLIRRDVVKDEEAPPEQEMAAQEIEHPLVAWDPVPLPELVPEKEWVEIADPQALAPAPPLQRRSREAYLQWRTLMDALEES